MNHFKRQLCAQFLRPLAAVGIALAASLGFAAQMKKPGILSAKEAGGWNSVLSRITIISMQNTSWCGLSVLSVSRRITRCMDSRNFPIRLDSPVHMVTK